MFFFLTPPTPICRSNKFFCVRGNKNVIIQAFENDIVELNGLELSAVEEIVNYFYTGHPIYKQNPYRGPRPVKKCCRKILNAKFK